VSDADVQVSLAILGFMAWPVTSFCVCGEKVRSLGAVPAGSVCAENSGAASLPTLTPGACWGLLVGLGEMRGKGNTNRFKVGERKTYAFGGHRLGAGDRGVEFSLVGDGSGLRLADMVGGFLSKRNSK